jgi:hypothetical protein
MEKKLQQKITEKMKLWRKKMKKKTRIRVLNRLILSKKVFQVVPRSFISKSYLEAEGGLKENHFSTHKKISLPYNAQTKSGRFDAFFAATLHMDDDEDILI